jgi:hypothetical protein
MGKGQKVKKTQNWLIKIKIKPKIFFFCLLGGGGGPGPLPAPPSLRPCLGSDILGNNTLKLGPLVDNVPTKLRLLIATLTPRSR